MAIATVFMVGVEQLPLVPEYLNLGSVVVIAPDAETQRRWVHEQEEHTPARDGERRSRGTVVDLAGRRIISDGLSLPLSDLEYRVLSALLSPIGRACSFRELRASGWGDGHEIPADVYSVRALVQRLRAKLQAAQADLRLEAVRGYGFRAAIQESSDRLPGSGRLGA